MMMTWQVKSQALGHDEAVLMTWQVKSTFSDRPVVYADFLEVMRQFKESIIDTPTVIEKVGKLFHGYPTLILVSNAVLRTARATVVIRGTVHHVALCR